MMMTYQPQPSVCPNAHTDIVSRLEAATGPDRQIDVLVAMLFNPNSGLTYEDYGDGTFSFSSDAEAPAYTASLDASLALVGEKLPGDRIVGVTEARSEDVEAHLACRLTSAVITIRTMTGWQSFSASAPNAPLAVLLALFRALPAPR